MSRGQKNIRASWWATGGNTVLAVLKAIIGFGSSSSALIATARNMRNDISKLKHIDNVRVPVELLGNLEEDEKYGIPEPPINR